MIQTCKNLLLECNRYTTNKNYLKNYWKKSDAFEAEVASVANKADRETKIIKVSTKKKKRTRNPDMQNLLVRVQKLLVRIQVLYTEAKMRFANTSENTTKSSSIKCNKKNRNKPRISKKFVEYWLRICDLEKRSLTP